MTYSSAIVGTRSVSPQIVSAAKLGHDRIAIAIAHELSHVVLDSIHHPLRGCEKATAMLLGFRAIIFCASSGVCAQGRHGRLPSTSKVFSLARTCPTSKQKRRPQRRSPTFAHRVILVSDTTSRRWSTRRPRALGRIHRGVPLASMSFRASMMRPSARDIGPTIDCCLRKIPRRAARLHVFRNAANMRLASDARSLRQAGADRSRPKMTDKVCTFER